MKLLNSARLSGIVFLLIIKIANPKTWSNCSTSCGGGLRTMKRCAWGNVCSTVYRKCNTHPCVSGWGLWQPCSKSCGGGIKFKINKCSLNSLVECAKTYNDCNIDACKPVLKCPPGYKYRYKDMSSCCKHSREQCGTDAAVSRRIVGGRNANQGQWPWAAALVRSNDKVVYCGGSLIHKRWLITAAHCFDTPEDSYVLLGSVAVKSPALGHQIVKIEKTYIHHGYKGAPPTHDIALVKLKKDVAFTRNIKPICLPKGEIVQPATTCWVLGWGLTKWHDDTSSPDRLQQVALKVYPLDACVQGYRLALDNVWKVLDTKQHICVGKLSGGNSSCGGDSGGPVVCQRCSSCSWYLAATVSAGSTQCGTAGLASINMDVYRYEYWIRKFVKFADAGYFVC